MLVNIPYMEHMGTGGYHFVPLKSQGPSASSGAGGRESCQWRSCLETSRRAIADMVNVDILPRKIAMFDGKSVENYGKLWKMAMSNRKTMENYEPRQYLRKLGKTMEHCHV